ncbi:MAG: dTDP-4-dehydrorhamnose 3,5-epimerase [Aquificaceae bacterium]|nr:dTDP-4-dehydrorhamnose 3,5-epimerase [Aquificaceae bacterium]MDW8237140.1 dTDP-4-dehydrorhamnose 3,5-epimerase [Aquificaceae bacterium]
MPKFSLLKTKLEGVMLIEPTAFEDHRGFFMESYNLKELEELGLKAHFVQDNHSLSVQAGVLRGIHFQLEPMAQSKLVRCLKGAIYDVVVDLRPHSPTFAKWEAFILTEHNKRQVFVPRGFGHAILTLSPNTEILYKVDQYYSPQHDKAIRYDDPWLNIDWPIKNPILSQRDKEAPYLEEILNEINFSKEP